MATIRRKTQKKFGKRVTKLVKQYGPEAALGAATALVNTIIDQATEKSTNKGKKDKAKKDKPAKKESKGAAPKGGKAKVGSKKSKKVGSKKSKKAEPAT